MLKTTAVSLYHRLTGTPMLLSFYGPYLIFSISTAMLVPVLPLYAADFDVAYGLVGLVIGAEALGTILGDIPAGILLRRYGTKRIMLVGLAGTLAAAVALFFSTAILAVLVCRLVSGFTRALSSVAQHSHLTTRVPMIWRGRAIAMFGGTFRVGGFMGPALGGGLALLFGLRVTFLAFASGVRAADWNHDAADFFLSGK